MKLKKYQKYTCQNVSIKWEILNIIYEREDFVKVKLQIFNMGLPLFRPKYYKLKTSMIQHWEEV